MKNWQREQIPRTWRENEARKTEIAVRDCVTNNLERVEELNIYIYIYI